MHSALLGLLGFACFGGAGWIVHLRWKRGYRLKSAFSGGILLLLAAAAVLWFNAFANSGITPTQPQVLVIYAKQQGASTDNFDQYPYRLSTSVGMYDTTGETYDTLRVNVPYDCTVVLAQGVRPFVVSCKPLPRRRQGAQQSSRSVG